MHQCQKENLAGSRSPVTLVPGGLLETYRMEDWS